MSDEEVKVGNVTKAAKKPVPGKATATAPVASTAPAVSIEEVNAKLDAVIKHLQAIDWKMWVYLKANNYID
jgi:3-oxoacyl-ACP reductase-like protein